MSLSIGVELQKFSAVISVFSGDLTCHFKLAINSLLCQTIPPDEIIIVADGPLESELKQSLTNFSENASIKIIELESNVGPGIAKHHAVLASKNPLIAVMDSDDISVSDRFEKQLIEFASGNIDVVGGFIEEFEKEPGDLRIIRPVPLDMDSILNFVKRRNPINHVTLMFKKEVYKLAGGYTGKRHAEDWDLIIKMLSGGAIIKNLPSVLVNVRAGKPMLGKRKRIKNLIDRFDTFHLMYKLGVINLYQLITNLLVSVILLVFPKNLLWVIYRFLLRKKY